MQLEKLANKQLQAYVGPGDSRHLLLFPWGLLPDRGPALSRAYTPGEAFSTLALGIKLPVC